MNRETLLRNAKTIHVPVHGSVPISSLAKYFIDNRYFQRLDKLKQLGTCDYVYRSAKHTRFEHSVGTYYLADVILTRIQVSSDNIKLHEWLETINELQSHYYDDVNNLGSNRLGLNDWIKELVKIAALCHDLGHGPYSHVFDDVFIKNSIYKDHPMATHESRSCVLVKMIVDESNVLKKFVTEDDVKFIQSLIDPDENRIGFIYQIISNNLNGLDVDKYDYLCRDALHIDIGINNVNYSRLINNILVIDNKIVYPEQAEYDIYNIFLTRHQLHRRVYGHKGVISAQYIITQIMHILDGIIDIAKSITEPDKFVRMTDDYILQYMEFILQNEDMFKDKLSDNKITELKILRNRIDNHKLYPHIGTIVTKDPIDIGMVSEEFDSKDYMIFRNKVGFVSGNKLNPLDRIYVYKTKDLMANGANVSAHRINKSDITHTISDVYQEYITMVFSKVNDPWKHKKDVEKFRKIKNTIIYS